jgi:hypothetical protein
MVAVEAVIIEVLFCNNASMRYISPNEPGVKPPRLAASACLS